MTIEATLRAYLGFWEKKEIEPEKVASALCEWARTEGHVEHFVEDLETILVEEFAKARKLKTMEGRTKKLFVFGPRAWMLDCAKAMYEELTNGKVMIDDNCDLWLWKGDGIEGGLSGVMQRLRDIVESYDETLKYPRIEFDGMLWSVTPSNGTMSFEKEKRDRLSVTEAALLVAEYWPSELKGSLIVHGSRQLGLMRGRNSEAMRLWDRIFEQLRKDDER